jgi:hypothetical protein
VQTIVEEAPVLISWDNLFICFFPDLGLDGGGEDHDEEEGGDHESFLEAMAALDGKKK